MLEKNNEDLKKKLWNFNRGHKENESEEMEETYRKREKIADSKK